MAVIKTIQRLDRDMVQALGELSSPTLHEAMGKKGALPSYIKPIYPGMKVVGSAITVRTRPGDNLAIHRAIALAEPGDVLIVDAGGYTEGGAWGDIMTTAAMLRGITGLVIDGCVRDAIEIKEMGFPICARGTCMKGTTKDLPGDINVPLFFPGVVVNPGDVVVGDDDGVVIVPQEEAVEALKGARAREAKEEGLRQQMRAGKTTLELLNLGEILQRTGME